MENANATNTNPIPTPQAEPPKKIRRVGSFSFGLALIFSGVLLLVKMVMPSFDIMAILRFAPALLIVLGVEVLSYAAIPNVKLKYDWLGILLCFVLLCGVGVVSVFGGYLVYFQPEEVLAFQENAAAEEKKVNDLLSADHALADKIYDVTYEIYRGDFMQPITHLYVTLYRDTCADKAAFAAVAREILDTCKAGGIEPDTFRMDTLERDMQDGDVTYSMHLSTDWQRNTSAARMEEAVWASYYYNGNEFSSYEELEDYRDELTRDTLAEEYYEQHGEYPSEEWLDEAVSEPLPPVGEETVIPEPTSVPIVETKPE